MRRNPPFFHLPPTPIVDSDKIFSQPEHRSQFGLVAKYLGRPLTFTPGILFHNLRRGHSSEKSKVVLNEPVGAN